MLKLQYFGHLIRRLTHWKRPCCWERLRAGGEGGDKGWDGWKVSLTQWTWVWAKARRQWRAGKLEVHGVAELDKTEQLNKKQQLFPMWSLGVGSGLNTRQTSFRNYIHYKNNTEIFILTTSQLLGSTLWFLTRVKKNAHGEKLENISPLIWWESLKYSGMSRFCHCICLAFFFPFARTRRRKLSHFSLFPGETGILKISLKELPIWDNLERKSPMIQNEKSQKYSHI